MIQTHCNNLITTFFSVSSPYKFSCPCGLPVEKVLKYSSEFLHCSCGQAHKLVFTGGGK